MQVFVWIYLYKCPLTPGAINCRILEILKFYVYWLERNVSFIPIIEHGLKRTIELIYALYFEIKSYVKLIYRSSEILQYKINTPGCRFCIR